MSQRLKFLSAVLTACLWLCCGVLAAEFVTPAQALDISGKWIAYFRSQASSPLKQLQAYSEGEFRAISERRVFSDAEALPELYFARFADGSFAILPADDNLPPILAYSAEPQIVADTLPPAFYAIMEAYASGVRHHRITGITKPDFQRQWQKLAAADYSFIDRTQEVRPLIDVKWNQGWPYNELCPSDPNGSGGHVPVGCMAVALAQMMKYWNRPFQGEGSNSYISANYGYQSVNFGETTYQWDEMPPRLYDSNLAVATLLYHCGVSMNMHYTAAASGANWYYVPMALHEFFKYPDAEYLMRDDYPDGEWTDLMRDQLNQGIPLFYYGDSGFIGHAFDIDGYQAGDYFHVNFGWGGAGDAYYHIDAINYGLYGFNFDQSGIFNAVPQGYSLDGVRVRLRAHEAPVAQPITVSISTDPLMSAWNVGGYNLSVSYPQEGLIFDSAEIDETISEGGNLLVDSSAPGLLQLAWDGDKPLLGGGSLLKLNFIGTEAGSYLIRPLAMDYAGVSVNDLGTVTVSVNSNLESPAESSLRLSNALRVNYGETATLNLYTSYLPPSWNITHYEFDLEFPADKITFGEVQTAETLSAAATGIHTQLQSPGLLQVSVDSEDPITGLSELLLKICFIATGNSSSLSVAQLQLKNFYYNDIAVPGTINAMVSLAPMEEVPEAPQPLGAWPNPFKTDTVIHLHQKEEAHLSLEIYNLKGQKVCTLHEGELPEGNHRFPWQGRDQDGKALGSGIYFLKARTAAGVQVKKITLIR
ncbi:MAG TPA: hypothetical protein DCQ12_02560 [Candidatus Cloacimonas sp.]|jgi:hypothetical protein|nr:hypothetical protein [Candidatus Cloacimonas sp.]